MYFQFGFNSGIQESISIQILTAFDCLTEITCGSNIMCGGE